MLTGRVTGSIGRFVASGGSPARFAGAQVVFTPDVAAFSTDDPELLIPDQVVCRLSSDGDILDPTDPSGETVGVTLAASDSVDGGFTWSVRVSGSTFTSVTFRIVVPAGETVDIASAVHVPADPGRVVDRLTGLVATVQEWVDDPMTLPDVGPAVEAAAGSASAAAVSAQQAHESALAAAGSAQSAAGDRERAEAAAETAEEAAANASQSAITAWPDPDNPDLLILEFPAFLEHPDGTSVIIPTVTGA